MRIYAIITYVHFPLHLGVTVWFFVVVRVVKPDNSPLCDDVAKQQCLDTSLFWRTAYIVLALLVLLIEFCEIPDVCSIFSSHWTITVGALIVTNYTWQIGRGQSYKRQTRQRTDDAFSVEAEETQYSVLTSSHGLDQVDDPFDNAEQYEPYREARSSPPTFTTKIPRTVYSFMDRDRPAVPEEVGYGGGTWTYHEISEEEKARMGRLEREHFSNTDDAEVLPRYPEH